MTLSSMTGFARGHGVSGPYAWAWEVKSVNGKGLDLRLRFPSGWDAIEAPARAREPFHFAPARQVGGTGRGPLKKTGPRGRAGLCASGEEVLL